MSTAPRFWKRYIDWADLGVEFGIDECRKLLREDPSNLTPAMHIFSASNAHEAEVEARKLLQQSRDDNTTGARYVASIVEGTLRDTGRAGRAKRDRSPPTK